MTNITIVSPFRDSGEYIGQYFNRVELLDYPRYSLRIVAVEGDSIDETFDQLSIRAELDGRYKIVKCDVNKPKHGSVINEERLQVLSTVFNAGLGAVNLDWSDYVLFIPGDVIYDPNLIINLLRYKKDLVAPWFWTYNEHGIPRFYDTWAFCYQGEYFEQYPKSWFDEKFLGISALEMDTVGGVILMKSEIVRAGCNYTPQEVDRGLCKMAKEKGFEVWGALDTGVFHP